VSRRARQRRDLRGISGHTVESFCDVCSSLQNDVLQNARDKYRNRLGEVFECLFLRLNAYHSPAESSPSDLVVVWRPIQCFNEVSSSFQQHFLAEEQTHQIDIFNRKGFQGKSNHGLAFSEATRVRVVILQPGPLGAPLLATALESGAPRSGPQSRGVGSTRSSPAS